MAADVWVLVGSDLVWQLRDKRRCGIVLKQFTHTHAHTRTHAHEPGGSKGIQLEFPPVFRNVSAHVLKIRRVCLS